MGSTGFVRLSEDEFGRHARGGPLVHPRGYGWPEDLERTEDGGCLPGADPSKVSHKAIARGFDQIGTLGSGNHYLEIQVVHPEYVYDAELASQFGITQPEQVVVMFHCGSRGFGHQVATDYLQVFLKVTQRNTVFLSVDVTESGLCGRSIPPEGQDYFAAMKFAANMAFANRQVILHRIREVFSDIWQRDPVDLGLHMVYDVAYNTAKLEEHEVDGDRRQVLVHRKGATRAFGPGHAELPERFQPRASRSTLGAVWKRAPISWRV